MCCISTGSGRKAHRSSRQASWDTLSPISVSFRLWQVPVFIVGFYFEPDSCHLHIFCFVTCIYFLGLSLLRELLLITVVVVLLFLNLTFWRVHSQGEKYNFGILYRANIHKSYATVNNISSFSAVLFLTNVLWAAWSLRDSLTTLELLVPLVAFSVVREHFYLGFFFLFLLSHFSKSKVWVNLGTAVEGNPKNPFSIATKLRWRGGRDSFLWIALLYPWSLPYNAKC